MRNLRDDYGILGGDPAETGAIQAALDTHPYGETLFVPRPQNGTAYVVNDTPRHWRCFPIIGDGVAYGQFGLHGSGFRQITPGKSAFYWQGSNDSNGSGIEKLWFGGEVGTKHALLIGSNVGRMSMRDVFLAGAGESLVKVEGAADASNHILNGWENVRASMGWMTPLGFAMPSVAGFDFSEGGIGPVLMQNCGIAGITANAPAVHMNGGGTFINFEVENCYHLMELGPFASRLWFLMPYDEGCTIGITGTPNQPYNCIEGHACGSSKFVFAPHQGVNGWAMKCVSGVPSDPGTKAYLTTETPVVLAFDGRIPNHLKAMFHIIANVDRRESEISDEGPVVIENVANPTHGEAIFLQMIASGAGPDLQRTEYASNRTGRIQNRRWSGAYTCDDVTNTAGGAVTP